jgi:hypothetical protein
MRLTIVGLGVWFILLGNIASASVIAIPLPELTGAYPARRVASINLSPPPTLIRGAWLRVTGTQNVGASYCGNNPDPFPYPLALNGYMDDSWWSASEPLPLVSGPFDCSAPFDSLYLPPYYPNPNWDFLLGGQAQVMLVGDSPITVCSPATNPSGTVDSVIFYLDADFPVATQSFTWGRLRSTYR